MLKTWIERWMQGRAGTPVLVPVPGQHIWLAGCAGSGKTLSTQRSLSALAKRTRLQVMVITDHPKEWEIPWNEPFSLVVRPVERLGRDAAEDYYEAIWRILTQTVSYDRLRTLVIEGGDAAILGIAAALNEIHADTINQLCVILHTQSVIEMPATLRSKFASLRVFRCPDQASVSRLQAWYPHLDSRQQLAVQSQRPGAAIALQIS